MERVLEAKNDRLLTTSEAAALIGVTPGRIWQLIQSGELSGIRLGTIWLVPEKELDKFKVRQTKVGRPRSGSSQV
jgi:excisionase family DNA binding protein